MGNTNITEKAVNTLRVLAAEAISNAGSGHTGIALGAAPIMHAIYRNMNIDPRNPAWFNRDRFVLSAGHGSALLYAALKCFGFPGIDLSTFRTSDSPLSGHPELNEKIGVDCSTGPLGQGLAMSVGLAAAEKKLAATYGSIVDHYTYCLVGDGCLQEGISYEACALAGLWQLNKLIVLYDCNRVTLDGGAGNTSAEDAAARFAAMKWNVLLCSDGNNERAISEQIRKAKVFADEPTIIIVNTEIGYGAKNAGSNKAHGQVLTAEECALLREKWGLKKERFAVDGDVLEYFSEVTAEKKREAAKWRRELKLYEEQFPSKYKNLAEFWEKPVKRYKCRAEGKKMATRDAGHIALNQIARKNVRLWGGSADVSSTTKAYIDDGGLFSAKKPKAGDIAFGIREFAMAAITNGIALHGFTPYCSTFLAFSDYCKAAIRLTAMMNLPVTYIFSHDGLGNAQDGPTHQGTEHIAALRLIPDMSVFRPADDLETAAVYEYVFEQQKPACILLSRGAVPSPSGANEEYKNPRAVLLASGAEVHLAVEAQKILTHKGVPVNVISVPNLEMFDWGGLGGERPVICIEMGSGMPWWAFLGKNGLRGDVVSFDTFGESDKEAVIMEHLGFTPEAIAERVMKLL